MSADNLIKICIFEQAKRVLETQGATLVEVNIPAHRSFFIDEDPEAYFEGLSDRNLQTRAYYYEEPIKGYDNDEIRSFVGLLDILPESNPNYEYVQEVADTIKNGEAKPWEALPEVAAALEAIAQLRTQGYKNFMSANGWATFLAKLRLLVMPTITNKLRYSVALLAFTHSRTLSNPRNFILGCRLL